MKCMSWTFSIKLLLLFTVLYVCFSYKTHWFLKRIIYICLSFWYSIELSKCQTRAIDLFTFFYLAVLFYFTWSMAYSKLVCITDMWNFIMPYLKIKLRTSGNGHLLPVWCGHNKETLWFSGLLILCMYSGYTTLNFKQLLYQTIQTKQCKTWTSLIIANT